MKNAPRADRAKESCPSPTPAFAQAFAETLKRMHAAAIKTPAPGYVEDGDTPVRPDDVVLGG